MVTVKTTRYYLNIFGSIQRKFEQISNGSQSKDDAFQYQFINDTEFFDHFRKLNVKTDGGKLYKGNTMIGIYDRPGAHRDRPRPRLNSQKFKDEKRKD